MLRRSALIEESRRPLHSPPACFTARQLSLPDKLNVSAGLHAKPDAKRRPADIALTINAGVRAVTSEHSARSRNFELLKLASAKTFSINSRPTLPRTTALS